jgi:hypothetical protein
VKRLRERWVAFVRSPRSLAALLGISALAVYVRTLAPSVPVIDGGELSAVACTLGIAHPTGYPLFTLLGRLFSILPISPEEIVRLNLMAAFLTALAMATFFLTTRQFAAWAMDSGASPGTQQDRAGVISIAAAGGTLLLAFSETVWSQAVAIEVYSLHILFVSLLLLLFPRATTKSMVDGRKDARLWSLFAFVLGLSFANHMTTILLAPGFLYLYAVTQGWKRDAWLRMLSMVPWFLLGLSAYLYLPVRAGQNPALNWGNVTSFERFLWHASGKQYRVWILSSTEVAGRQFNYFVNSLPGEFAVVGLLVGLLGFVAVWVRKRRAAIFSLLLFAGCVSYAVNYDIHDIDSYFLLAYITLALWATCGLVTIARWLSTRLRLRTLLVAGLVLLPCLTPLVVHWRGSDRSTDFMVEDYTANMFSSVDQGAIVLSYQWDYWVSASSYYQMVRHLRPDIVVIDKELLRRSWYIKELGQRYGWLVSQSREEVDAFLAELNKFEHDLPYNPAVIQARFVAMIASFIQRNLPIRAVYVTPEIEGEFTQGLQRIPHGLAFRLAADTVFRGAPFPDFRYRPITGDDPYRMNVRRLYAEAFVARGAYYAGRGDSTEAERSYVAAESHFPGILRQRAPFRGIPGR